MRRFLTVVTLTTLGLLAAFGLASASGGSPGNGGRVVPPGRKPDGSGQWGNGHGPKTDNWDPRGPGVWVSDDCSEVRIGARFWPHENGTLAYDVDRRTPGKTFDPAVAKGRVCIVNDSRALPQQALGCSVLDYIDTLIIEQGIDDPKLIVDQITSEQAPLCYESDPSTWPPAFFDFYNWLLDHTTNYVELKQAFLDDGPDAAVGFDEG